MVCYSLDNGLLLLFIEVKDLDWKILANGVSIYIYIYIYI